MSLLKTVALALATIAIGCNTRALDSRHGTGGSVVLSGNGGAAGSTVTDGGGRSDAPRDAQVIEIIERPYCGDGILDPGEACDDGNQNPGDGCTALCQIPCHSICGSCGAPTPCITMSLV